MSANATQKEPEGTRGFPEPLLVVGEALQSISLGVLERGDQNAAFTTRAVGLIILALLLLVGSLIASFASPLKDTLIGSALTVPVVRADLMFLLFSRLVLVFVWASKLRPTKILYANEVYPLQAASIIWNDCKPVAAHNRKEDGHSAIVDILTNQRQLWRPTKQDTFVARLAKFPMFFIVFVLRYLFLFLERILLGMLRWGFEQGVSNRTLTAVHGKKIRAPGYTALITDEQLTWVQDFTMQDGHNVDPEQIREARRVLVRALHIANLLSFGGYTRLHEHSAGDHAMSEYFAASSGNKIIKTALSKITELNVLAHLENGNKLERGGEVPRQVMWARLIVASMRGLAGEGRWRGPLVAAIYQVTEQNMKAWYDIRDETPIHRHVHSVSRRWMVDWVMFIWWEVDIKNALAEDPDAMIKCIVQLLETHLVHNTISLPHAVSEMAFAADGTNSEIMAARLLGADWRVWLSKQRVGESELREKALGSGEWKCMTRSVEKNDTVDSKLYEQRQLAKVLDVENDAPTSDQIRARFANRIVSTLATKIKVAWLAQPYRFLDPPERARRSIELEPNTAADSVV